MRCGGKTDDDEVLGVLINDIKIGVPFRSFATRKPTSAPSRAVPRRDGDIASSNLLQRAVEHRRSFTVGRANGLKLTGNKMRNLSAWRLAKGVE